MSSKLLQLPSQSQQTFYSSATRTSALTKHQPFFHIHHGSSEPLARNELPPLFLVSLVELMTLIYNADAASPSLLHTRLITPSTLTDPLVEGQEMGMQQQFSLEDPQSRLKWLPPSKPKGQRSPAPTRRYQLSWNQHYPGNLPTPTILQSLYSFAEIANHYVKLSFHQILIPLEFAIPLTPYRLPFSFNESLAILPFQVTNKLTNQPKNPPPLPPKEPFLFHFLVLFRL